MAANATIGSLRVELGLDSATFQDGLKSAKASLANFGQTAALAGAALATAMVAAGAAVGVAVKGAIDEADRLDELGQKIGVAVTELSRLKYAAEINGVPIDTLSAGIRKLSQNMGEVAGGGGAKASKALDALGISVTDANGNLRSSTDVLKDVAEDFKGMQDGAGKTAIAMALFGKSGAELIPLLNIGAEGIANFEAEADKLGITLSAETGAAAGKFNENLDRLKAVGQGLTTQLAASLLPALEDITSGFLATAQNGEVMKGVGQALGVTLKVLATIGVGVATVFGNLGRALTTVAKVVVQVFKGDFAGAAETYRTAVEENIRATAASARSVAAIWTGVGGKVAASAPAVGDQIAAPIMKGAEKTKAAAKDIKTEAEKAADAIRDYIIAQRKMTDERGMSSEQIRFREQLAKASEALKLGLEAEADQIIGLATAFSLTADEAMQLDKAQVALLRTPADLLPSAIDAWSAFMAEFEHIQDSFYSVAQSVDDIFYGISGNDWIGAFGGLLRAIDQVKLAFSAAGDEAQRMGAVAGAASAVGGAIGGKAGGALSGAASGAVLGAKLGSFVPGIGNVGGALIGGALGAIGSLFGGSKAKKRAKKEAAARAEAERVRKAEELAEASRVLDIELLKAQGKGLEALALERQHELSVIDESLRSRTAELYAYQDQAAAEAQLAAVRRELLGITDAAALAEMDRKAILDGLPDSVRGLQDAAFKLKDAQDALAAAEEARDRAVAAAEARVDSASDALSEAFERASAEFKETADRFRAIADDIASVNRDLAQEAGASDPAKQLAQARAAFNAVAGRSDEASLAALPEAARAYADALKASAPDQRTLTAGLADIRRALTAGEASARGQASAADQQLGALREQVSGLITLNDSVLSVADGIANLTAAIAQSAAEQQAALDAVAAAAKAAADAAAAAQVANDNAAASVAGFDAAAAAARIAGTATSAAMDVANGAGSSASMAAALEAALGPYLVSLVRNTATSAEVADLQRDQIEAAA